MQQLRLLAGAVAVLALVATVFACGDEEGDDARVVGGTLKVYSSLPLQGGQRLQTTAAVGGIKLALDLHKGKAGGFEIKYTSLDDSTAQAGTWTAEATSANARKVAQDDKAIAYIGEANSGASAISMPILNEVPIAQVSPSNTAVGLTSDEPGADHGEPEKYYPKGKRHYLRIVPKDTVQGAALATVMNEDGCGNVAILNDREVYGAGLARNIETTAKKLRMNVATSEGIDPKAANFRSLAAKLASEGIDCFVFAGATPSGAVQLFKDVSAALPEAKLYGPDGVSNPEFFNAEAGGLPADVAAKVKITVATLSPGQYPPEGRMFFERYRKRYGVSGVDPYAIYGYEAMDLILDTCDKLGEQCSDRRALINALFATKNRGSVLGSYDIDVKGDTTLTDYGVYRVEDGELVFDQTVKAAQ